MELWSTGGTGGSTLRWPGSAGRTRGPVAIDVSGVQLNSLSMVGYIQKWQRASHHHSHDVSGQEGRAQDPGREEANLQRAGRGQVLQSMQDPVRGWATRTGGLCCVGRRGRQSFWPLGSLDGWMQGIQGSQARAQQRSCAWAFQPCWLRG